MSTTPDITEGLPFGLGGGVPDVSAAFQGDQGWDVSIGGLGFRLRPSSQFPYQRTTEPIRKQQFDASQEAGEQSLSSWWLRSQASWHMGAGIKWYEPGAEEQTAYRFETSCGVNPWELGQLTLLHRMDKTITTGRTFVVTAQRSGLEGAVMVSEDAIRWVALDGATSSVTGTAVGFTELTQPVITGTVLWIGCAAGVYRVDIETGTVVQVYTAAGPCRVWWVKGRLVVAVGSTLYEVPPRDTTGGVVETNGSSMLVNTVPGWTWTGVAETSAAVLASGYGGMESALYRFTLVDNAGLLEWSAGEQVALMPPGERIECLGVYLSSFLVLGTTLGARAGAVSATGDAQYGPLTVETAQPVRAVTFHDRFAYVGVTSALPNGMSGCARIDLSAEEAGRFPWAWDVSTATTDIVRSVAMLGSTGRVTLGAEGGLFVESDTAFVTEGWLSTGQVRFRTVEPKLFQRFQLNAELHDGAIRVTAETPDGVEHRLFSYTPETGVDEPIAVNISRRPTNTHLLFRMYLTPPGDDPTATPVVTGWQVKALPAPQRVELVQMPLQLFDSETDRYGVTRAQENGAYARYQALKALEMSGAAVRVHDLRTSESMVATVESVELFGESPPDGPHDGFGGTCVVTVRRL